MNSAKNCDYSNLLGEIYICSACGHRTQIFAGNLPRRNCTAKCQSLGPQRNRNGIPETVKCNCNGKTTEIWHAVHDCEVHGRCLPTFKGPFDDDHQMEAKLYHLCHGCEQRELASA